MNVWWKLGIVAAFLAIYGATVWDVKDKFDEAAKAKALRDQIEATKAEQDRIEERAKAAESALASERIATAKLNKQWSAARAQKNHTDCRLPDESVSVLRAATGPDRDLPR